jgi:hypothetical protein
MGRRISILGCIVLILLACDPYYRLRPMNQAGNKSIVEYDNCRLTVDVFDCVGGLVIVDIGFNSLRPLSLKPKELKVFLNSDSLSIYTNINNIRDNKITINNNKTIVKFACQKPGVHTGGRIVKKGDKVTIFAKDLFEIEGRLYNLDSLFFIMP